MAFTHSERQTLRRSWTPHHIQVAFTAMLVPVLSLNAGVGMLRLS
jgi:hypothetical protein